jgi:hypothetical protein
MGAVPRPDSSGGQNEASSILTQALAEQAKLRAAIGPMDDRIQHAKEIAAQEVIFPWTTRDGRDADMLVYYQPSEPLAILVAHLQRIDGCTPSLNDRVTYEQQFASEMDEAGETWEQVASYAWERRD